MAKFSLPALFGLVLLAPGVSHSQAYPSRPVRMIVPYVAGGPVDSMARLLVPRLVDVWGQQVVIDNRGGANSIVGSEVAARSAPDGYTLALISASFTVNVSLYPKLPFDAIRDFTPITLVASGPGMLVTHPSLPVRNLKDLVALAKARPGEPAMGSAGTGSILHLALELLNTQAGTKMTHVPYKGAGPAVIDVIAGQVNGMFVDLPVISPYVKSGKVRAIAVASPKRSVYFPDVPTTAESGYPGVEVSNQYSLLLPAKTPRDIVMKLHDAVVKTMATPEVREKFISVGADPLIMSPEEFTQFIRKDIEKWARVAKAANVKMD